MNIAIFSPNKNPYSETFIQAHKKFLNGNVFYFYGRRGNIKLEKQKVNLGILDRLHLKKIKEIDKVNQAVYNDALILKFLKQLSIKVILVEYGIHAHSLLPLLKKSKVPFVVHFHGYDATQKNVLKQTNQYKDVFKSVSKVVAVSKVMEQKILNLGCPQEKLVYNVYGPRPEFLTITPNFSKKQLIAIGRFTDKKAPYYTLFAFKEVLKTVPEAQLLMAGDGALLNTCKNLVHYWQMENNVTFLGVITPDTYQKLLQESIAFVQHSITAANGDMEGTPLSILEASAAGIPVISTIHAGIPDVIINEVTGLLCEEHQVEVMAQHMITLLSNESLAKQMGEAGKKNIKKHFTLERHIKELDTILKQAIE